MRTNGTKYEEIGTLPGNAQAVSVYAAHKNIRNPAYVYIKYERYLSGKGSNPGYTIRCWQGMNFVLPE